MSGSQVASFRIIGDQRERGIAWAAPRFRQSPGDWDRASCLLLENANNILACVLYSHWYPANSVQMHIAAVDGGKWLNRAFLATAFRVPFLEWNMRRVWGQVDSDNAKSINFCKRLGFVQEGRMRQGTSAEVDTLIFGLLKSECRFIGDDFGKAVSTRSAKSGHNGASPDGFKSGYCANPNRA